MIWLDDLDGMRRFPAMSRTKRCWDHLQMPLTKVPDPFGTHEALAITTTPCCDGSLIFGFEYEFISATEFYGRSV